MANGSLSVTTANSCDFTHSLAMLREFTIEQERSDSDAALISAHSVISVIPSEEIQMMIQEVKDLDEETVKVNKNVLKYNSFTFTLQISPLRPVDADVCLVARILDVEGHVCSVRFQRLSCLLN